MSASAVKEKPSLRRAIVVHGARTLRRLESELVSGAAVFVLAAPEPLPEVDQVQALTWFVSPRVADLRRAAAYLQAGYGGDGARYLTDMARAERLPRLPAADQDSLAVFQDWNRVLVSHVVGAAYALSTPWPLPIPAMVAIALSEGAIDITIVSAGAVDLTREREEVGTFERGFGNATIRWRCLDDDKVSPGRQGHFSAAAMVRRGVQPMPTPVPVELHQVSNRGGRCVYATLLERDEDYWCSLALARSLEGVSRAPLLVMLAPGYSPPWSRRAPRNCTYLGLSRQQDLAAWASEGRSDVLARLRLFGTNAVDRVIFIDPASLALGCLDNLFDEKAFRATHGFRFLPDESPPQPCLFAFSPSTKLRDSLMRHTRAHGSENESAADVEAVEWLERPFDITFDQRGRDQAVDPKKTLVVFFADGIPWSKQAEVPATIRDLWFRMLGPEYSAELIAWDLSVGGALARRKARSAPSVAIDVEIAGTAQLDGRLSERSSIVPISAHYTRQWNRDGVPIEGATGRRYTVVEADVGHDITLTLRATRRGYAPCQRTSMPVKPVMPTVMVDVLVQGSPYGIGAALTERVAIVPMEADLSRQWNRDSVPIVGATAGRYLLTEKDIGCEISLTIAASHPGYVPGRRTSAPVGPAAHTDPARSAGSDQVVPAPVDGGLTS